MYSLLNTLEIKRLKKKVQIEELNWRSWWNRKMKRIKRNIIIISSTIKIRSKWIRIVRSSYTGKLKITIGHRSTRKSRKIRPSSRRNRTGS